MVAVNDQGGVVASGFQALELSRDGSHGDQLSVRDAGGLEFVGLANVDEEQFFAGGDAALDVLGRGFDGGGRVHTRATPGIYSIPLGSGPVIAYKNVNFEASPGMPARWGLFWPIRSWRAEALTGESL